MIIIKITGGLGNQMFQYALGRCLEITHNVKVKYDITAFETYFRKYELEIFNVNPTYASLKEILLIKGFNPIQTKSLRRIIHFIRKELEIYNKERKNISPSDILASAIVSSLYKTYRLERKNTSTSDILKLKDNVYLDGYWQSENYFFQIEDIIRKDFALKEEMISINKDLSEEINTKNAVSIHIRRGDYIINSPILEICSLKYYQKAIDTIMNQVDNPHFYIFSDEPEWVTKNLQLPCDFTIVKNNLETNQYIDMILMSYCKHNIIANSSFSWWGAWLNNNPNKIVIAPKNWTSTEMYSKNRTPENWVRLENEWVVNGAF